MQKIALMTVCTVDTLVFIRVSMHVKRESNPSREQYRI